MEFITFLALIICGYLFGRAVEKKHFQSIIKREKQYNWLLSFSVKTPTPDVVARTEKVELVVGSVVISVDYFKRFVAGLRNFFGGNMTSYESLIDRGRREAILRMKEQAGAMNTQMIFNMKLETTSISKGEGKNIGSIEVYAYGTALRLKDKQLY